MEKTNEFFSPQNGQGGGYKYFPHTEADLKAMMEKVGVASLDELYAEVPSEIRFRGDYQLPTEMSELEVRRTVS